MNSNLRNSNLDVDLDLDPKRVEPVRVPVPVQLCLGSLALSLARSLCAVSRRVDGCTQGIECMQILVGIGLFEARDFFAEHKYQQKEPKACIFSETESNDRSIDRLIDSQRL